MHCQGSGIPHYATDEGIRVFFEVALHVEFIDDIDKYRENVVRRHKIKGEMVRDTPFARHLKEALEHLLRERSVSALEWCHMTGVSFWEDDRLYAYLQDLYGYFYGDRKEPPVAPDPEAPAPEKYWT